MAHRSSRTMVGFWRIAIAFAVPWAIAAGLLVTIRANRQSQPAPAVLRVSTLEPPKIRFNRDILPILSENCFACHGPDSAARKADLRLDTREPAIAVRSEGTRAIAPGHPDASELIRRITADRPSVRMPPEETTKTLTADEIELLRAWIAQGAQWEQHWSFIPLKPVVVPKLQTADSDINPIDAFIRTRLIAEGLEPSPPADRPTLIRRASLDITGLPPTPDETDAFVNDPSTDAYEHLVDRLLASPRYGEHMARYWLDAARYADTHGLHLDNHREIWPYRDWVINAFNNNKPFDEFTIEQLAGDLLPEPTTDQLIATGFNRNHVTTSEGGAIDAEYLMKYAADRVETTATVFMGLTVACAQCHDHKFDPITQREYYELFAFFNSVDSPAMDGNASDHPPILRVPSDEDKLLLAELRTRLKKIESALDAPDPAVDSAQREWRLSTRDAWTTGWEILEPTSLLSTAGATLTRLDDASILSEGDNPPRDTYEITAATAQTNLRMVRLEALTHDGLPFTGPGRADNANFVLSEIECEVASLADPAMTKTIHFIAAAADHEQQDGPYPASDAIDGVIDDTNGWAVEGFERRENRTAVFITADPFGYEGGSTITIRLRFETQFASHAIGRTRLAVSADPTLLEIIAPSGFASWHLAAPFTAENGKAAFDTAFGPESNLTTIDPDARFGGDNAIAWTKRPDLADGVVNTLEGENTATYVARTIHAPTPRHITLSLGSDDAIKVWLNGRLVHENYVARGAALDQDTVEIDLRQGENVLVMKIVNFSGGYGFAFRALGDTAGPELLRHIDLILAKNANLDSDQQTRLRRYFRANHSPRMRELTDELADTSAQITETESQLPTTLVMKELDQPRMTRVLLRGEYDQPREQVSPHVPDCLPPMDSSYPNNRLGLALWLTESDHPLTARVTVNRLWQQLFGTGLVKTAENLGTQGERPIHPELLDFLATEFIASAWDVKHVMRLMLTSDTYRQSSRVTPGMLERDPDNRLLARGPRYRLDAEVIRDQALAASGLLVERVGGPSVRPYQPDGLWKAVAYPDSNTRIFVAGEGDEQYRRSMYTYWKRTSPPPNMSAFDAPSRDTCTVRRARTNTPLQALVLLNDPQFVECARVIAARALRVDRLSEPMHPVDRLSEPTHPVDRLSEPMHPVDRLSEPMHRERNLSEPTPISSRSPSLDAIDARLTRAFRLILVRYPTEQELALLRDLYSRQLEKFQSNPQAAQSLIAVGTSMPDRSLDPIEHAAMTNICATILSLDEAVTKN